VRARRYGPTSTATPHLPAIGSDLLLATSEKRVEIVFVERRARDSGALVWQRTIELRAPPTNAYVRTDVKLEVLGDRIIVRAQTGRRDRRRRSLKRLTVSQNEEPRTW